MNNWIGITGKIAAGKTTIAKQLISEENNLTYINVDDFRRKNTKMKIGGLYGNINCCRYAK